MDQGTIVVCLLCLLSSNFIPDIQIPNCCKVIKAVHFSFSQVNYKYTFYPAPN